MFKNYIKISLRNLGRHKSASLINSIGLTIGITCCILIMLYVRDQLSYDRHHKNADRIYRVVGESINPYETFRRARTPNALAPTLKSEFPEIAQAVRIGKFSSVLVQNGEKRFYEEQFFVAEPEIFEVFTFNFLHGTQTALDLPHSVVLTATTAGKYFGDEDPIGQEITFENRLSFRVTGVIEDPPPTSHFRFDFLASAATSPAMVNRPNWLSTWNNSGFYTYVLLNHGSTRETLESMFPAFLDQHIAQVLDDDEIYKLHLQPLTRIHHYSHLSGEMQANGDIKYIYIFSTIAIIILLIACVNYMNLATARSVSRAKEVGLRKALGADRRQVIKQFVTDSLFLSMVAGILAIGLVELVLPIFSEVVGRELNLRWSAAWLGAFIALVFLVGMLSGSYPAFFLSAFQPARALKGQQRSKGSKQRATTRGALVAFQFVVSISLIACTLTVHRQLSYMRSKGLGFGKEQVVYVPIKEGSTRQQYLAIKTELLRNPSVAQVSFSSGLPGDVGWHSTARWDNSDDDNRIEIHHIMVDHDFVKLYQMEMVEGRDFSKDLTTDATEAYILNEAAVQAIGWESALGKRFSIWDREGEVIGVVADFHFESLHKKIGPLAFHIRPEWFSLASIRLAGDDLAGTLEYVEQTWKTFSPNRPVEYIFLDEQFDQMYRSEEQLATISSYFTFLAIFIACLGLFSLASFVAEQRTKEIAIRKVLGASAKRVISLLGKDLAKLLVLAATLASPLAYFAADIWLQSFAYRIDMEWWMLGLAGVMTFVISVFAVGLQAIKAALANPVDSLRYE